MEFHQNEKMNWQEQFMRMKRWYYRIRDKIDNDKEDFYLAFFESCHHFKNWLVKDGVATNKEVEDYIDQHQALQLAADICTFSKHAEITRTSRTGDFGTEVIGQKLLAMPKNQASYLFSVLKIKSGGKEQYNAFDIVQDCMNAWGKFLLSKSQIIPTMPQEVIYQNFKRWVPGDTGAVERNPHD